MADEKKTKLLNAVKVSETLFMAVTESAKRSRRKITDQIRHLIEQGLKAEEGMDVQTRLCEVEQQLKHLMIAERKPIYHPGRGSPQKTKGTASNG